MSAVTVDTGSAIAPRALAANVVTVVDKIAAFFHREVMHALKQGEPFGVVQAQLAARRHSAIAYECDSWVGWTRKSL